MLLKITLFVNFLWHPCVAMLRLRQCLQSWVLLAQPDLETAVTHFLLLRSPNAQRAGPHQRISLGLSMYVAIFWS